MKEITEQELIKKIEEVSINFHGLLDDLTQVIGMVAAGRLYGWRVIRLVHSRRLWTLACSLFGDLKQILPERGVLAYKSRGLMIVDKAGNYWDVIKGHSVAIPLHERKMQL